jgi:hypothetical protein
MTPSTLRTTSVVAVLFVLTTLLGCMPLATRNVVAAAPALVASSQLVLKVAATSSRSMAS